MRGAVSALLWCWCVCVSGLRPRAVTVQRCCAAGSRLHAVDSETLRQGDAGLACVPDHNETEWLPLIFAPVLNEYLHKKLQHWTWNYGSVPSCPTLHVLSDDVASYALLASNATLLPRGGARPVSPAGYCVDRTAALVCFDEQSTYSSSVAKCCSETKSFDGVQCVEDAQAAGVALQQVRELANGSGAGVGAGWPPRCAAGSRYSAAGRLQGAALVAGGELQLGGGARLAAGAWCGEWVRAEGAVLVLACESAARASVAVPALSTRYALYGAGLAVGAAFLAATLAASFALPAAHHALHWRCQTHYVAALMLGDILLAATQLAGGSVPFALCRTLAVCMHFLFLSAFFWLNTMCFNIWWTFRDFRPTSLERGQEAWRLRVYMVYAWGGPLALAGVAALLDHLPPAAAAAFLRPRFAERRCWFYGDTEILVYFFGPVGVLLLVNLALFVSTTRQLTCGLWRRDEVKSTSERAALGRVCAKLVVVMGVTWVADVVSWAAGGPEYVWYATDLLNALQGVLIFLVVGCQRHAWAALRRAVVSWCACGRGEGSGPRTRATHSSTHLPSCGESLTHTTAAPPATPAPPAPPVAKLPMETVC